MLRLGGRKLNFASFGFDRMSRETKWETVQLKKHPVYPFNAYQALV